MIALWLFVTFAPPPPVDDAGPEPKPKEEAVETPEAGSAKKPAEEKEIDSRRDPVLPYGEPEDDPELKYADGPVEPNLEYGEVSGDSNAEYDQRVQRPPPPSESLERQDPTVTGEAFAPVRKESPQRFGLELKFGPYLPEVDRNYEGEGYGPYASIYGRTDDTGATIGEPKHGLYSVLGFEWQFYHFGGPFSIGTQIGYFRDAADALIAEPEAGAEDLRSEADRTAFNLIPVLVLIGYRFELLADRYRVPLVPYAKGGLGCGFWWSTDGNGDISRNSSGEKGHGGSFGWQVNLGLMLRLDFLERGTSRDLDRQTGINHTYIFGEYQFSRLNGFGRGYRMDVGDDTFLLGLAIAF